jgi:four helix bundle protein
MVNAPSKLVTLEVWVEGMALVRCIYALSKTLPREEMFGLTSQLRRAVVSIPTNIAEGVGRGSPGEISRFSQIVLGSAYEVFTLLTTVRELELSRPNEIDAALEKLHQLTKRLSNFIRYQETRRVT